MNLSLMVFKISKYELTNNKQYSKVNFDQDKKKNQRTNKKHVNLKNKRFEHTKSSSSVLFLEILRKVGTYKYLH